MLFLIIIIKILYFASLILFLGEKNSFVISWITTDVANSTVRLGLSPEDLKEVVQVSRFLTKISYAP